MQIKGEKEAKECMYYLTVPDPYDYANVVTMRIQRRLGFSFLIDFISKILIQKQKWPDGVD